MLQKFQLQTRLEDSSWWMINFSDITIIREPSVRALKKGWGMVRAVDLLHRFVFHSLQGNQGSSVGSSGSQSGTSSCQSYFSSNSLDLRDKTGKENIFTTIGLYQVSFILSSQWAYIANVLYVCVWKYILWIFLFVLSIQGNQVAIKYIKNPTSCNYQKPSIIAEFNVVKLTTDLISLWCNL